jgi:hypothetical protein
MVLRQLPEPIIARPREQYTKYCVVLTTEIREAQQGNAIEGDRKR